MLKEFQRVTIIKIRKTEQKDINKDLQWLSMSLGLFGERDKEKSCFRVFIELLKSARKGQPLSSDEIALRTNITRATVIHHLNRLIETGIIIPIENKYFLRTDNLEMLIEEIKKDVIRVLEDMKQMATELDEELGLMKRNKGKTRVVE